MYNKHVSSIVNSPMQIMPPFALVLIVFIIGTILITAILKNRKVYVEVEFESYIPTIKLKGKMKVY